jgi:hypothetical protein
VQHTRLHHIPVITMGAATWGKHKHDLTERPRGRRTQWDMCTAGTGHALAYSTHPSVRTPIVLQSPASGSQYLQEGACDPALGPL